MLLGLSQIAQGIVMILAPGWFYRVMPGVDETGPLNAHLMRDTGGAFLLAGIGLVWFAGRRGAVAAGLLGAGYLCLHAALHVSDGIAGRERAAHLVVDLPVLGGLAAAALWAVWPDMFSARASGEQ
jgi:hypothetical protein